MKKSYDKLIALFLIIIFLMLPLMFIFSDKKDFSENENRYLEDFPSFSISSLFSGDYISDIEAYLSDHFPFRDTFMGIKTSVDKMLGKDDINGVYFAKDDYLIQKYNKPLNNDKIIKVLNRFYDKLNYVNMNLMLVPTSVSINSELLPKNSINYSELDTINYIYDKVNFDTVNVYDTLEKNNENYQMYYRLDHHWTTYAAYYAYVEYAKNNNLDYISIERFDIEKVTNSFNGTLYSKVSDYKRKSDSIYIFTLDNTEYEIYYADIDKKTDSLYEYSYLDKKDKYAMFLDNNHSIIEVTNKNINNNKELLVIKDSYANSIIPFLINHYEKIHVIDPRYYKKSISDYVKNNKDIKDILILYNTNNIDNDKGILSIK